MCTCCGDLVGRHTVWWGNCVSVRDRVGSFTIPVTNWCCWWCFWTDVQHEGGPGEHHHMAGATSPLPSHPLASGRRCAEHLQNPPHRSPATPARQGQPGRCQPCILGCSGLFGARPLAGGPGAWGRGGLQRALWDRLWGGVRGRERRGCQRSGRSLVNRVGIVG